MTGDGAMTTLKLIAAVILTGIIAVGPAAAADDKPKRTLKNDMTEVYLVLPPAADNFTEIFSKGVVYGRLRTNLFYHDWDKEAGTQKDNHAFGIGGSLLYKTAGRHGFSATVGLYTSQNPVQALNVDKADVGSVKAGKDTFDRNKIKNNGAYNGHWGMTTLAQAYLEYKIGNSDLRLGRQIFEGFLLRSNDTKMIPNTFMGLSLVNKDIPATTIKAAYFTRQKLRDHTDFHDVIAYDSWNENDDSVSHKGLTKSRLETASIDTELIVLGLTNKSVQDLTIDTWITTVPDLFYSVMAEVNYKVLLAGGWSVTPGLRYMRQFDDGAGVIGGAALNASLAGATGASRGYRDAASVDGGLWGLRAVLAKGAGSLLAGYTKVADRADLIAPWRGFPTGGYTRSMAQYNWEANTASWMIKVSYDFGKAGLVPGFRAALDYAVMDYDDAKEQAGGIDKTDRAIVHLDMWKQFRALPNLEAKIRIGLLEGDKTITGADPSYNEARFELNYLF
jgi:hypothetical protein